MNDLYDLYSIITIANCLQSVQWKNWLLSGEDRTSATFYGFSLKHSV